jgi:TetR/AcrR family transcriptional regulator, fatty acid metabolism regulator protein
MSRAPAAEPVDKRRLILDAAIRVFARQGFHRCRVSDIAREANVAYGLVYHYFRSKDEILNTIFSERWALLVETIEHVEKETMPVRDKLHAIASFIIDSYQHDPDLMKVIIVEVTRAANTFGSHHLEEITRAYSGIAGIVEQAQRDGELRDDISATFASLCFYGAIEQLLSAWIFDALAKSPQDFDQAKEMVVETVCRGLERGQPEEISGRLPANQTG